MATKAIRQRADKAADPVAVDPKHYTVEVENEQCAFSASGMVRVTNQGCTGIRRWSRS